MASTEVLELLLTARYVGRPAFTSFSNDIEGIVSQSNALTRLGAAFSAAGDLAITAGVAVAAGLGAAAKQAVDFEQSMTRIQTVTGYTAPQMQGLQNQIMNLADQYGQNANDIAQSSYLVLSGVQALGGGYQDVMNNQILPAIAAYVEASGAGQIGSVSWTDAIQKTLPVMVGMHQNFSQWANDLGILTMAEKSGLVTQQNLISGMTRYAPMAGLVGTPFDQAVAAIGALASSGVIGARTGTEMTTGIRTLLSGTSTVNNQLAAFGLTPQSFLNQQTGQLDDLNTIASILLPHLAGLDMTSRIAALSHLFGATGGRAFNQILSAGQNGAPSTLDIYNSLLKAENPQGGAANAMFGQAASIAGGPQSTMSKLLSQLQTLAITIGEQVLPVVIQFAQWLTNALHSLQDFVKAHPQVVQDAMKAVPALIGGGIGLKMLGGTLSFLGSPGAAKGSTVLGSFLGGFGSSGGAGAGLLGLVQRLGGFGFGLGRGVFGVPAALAAGSERVGESVANSGPGVLRFLTNALPNAFAAREEELAATHDSHPILGFMGGAAKDVGVGIKGAAGGIADLAKGIPALLTSIPTLIPLVTGLGTAFLTIVVPLALIAGAITIGVLAFTQYRTETMAVLGVIGQKLQPMFQAFAAVVMSAWAMIQQAWEAAQPAIDKAMKAFLTNLPKIVPLIELLGAIVGTVFALIVGALTALVTAFLSALPNIIGFFSGIISFVGDFAKLIIDLFTNWQAIPKDIQALWQDVLDIFSNFFGMIGNLVSGFVQGIINFFKYLWDELTGHSIIPDMIQDIINCFLRLPGELFGIVVGLIEGTLNLMGQFALLMVQAGLNLILGLIQGIVGSVGAVIDAIGNIASGIWNGIANFFGIASPSKLMATAGMNIDQGLAQGIAGSAALPVTAATNMANSVNTQFTSMATTATQTSLVITTAAQRAAAAMQTPAMLSPTAQSGPTSWSPSKGVGQNAPGSQSTTGPGWQPGTNGQLNPGETWQQAAGAAANVNVFSQPGFQQTPNLSTNAWTFWRNTIDLTVSQVSQDVQDKTGRMTQQVLRQYNLLTTNTELQLDKWRAQTNGVGTATVQETAAVFGAIPNKIQVYQLQILQQVRRQMAAMNSEVTTDTRTLANNAYQAGIGISQGMANGIYARKQAAMQAAEDLATSVDNQFRGRLQISSPSRLFFQHGADTVLGYIQGLLAHHADLNKTWDELGIPSTTTGNGNMNVGTLQVGSVNGLPANQANTPGMSTYQLSRAIQYERLNQRSNIQPISQYNLLQQLDLQYRYATQKTA